MTDLDAIRARNDQEHPRNLSAYREGSPEWQWLRAAMDRRDLLAEVDRLATRLIDAVLAQAWQQGHDAGDSDQLCHCGAWSDGECACGNYGNTSSPNPYL